VNKILQYFPDCDLRGQHNGLSIIAKKANLDTRSLGAGEFLVFVNRKRNRLKMYTSGNVVAYLKMPDGKYIDPRVIQYLPKHFNGAKINYDAAMTDVLKKQFPTWFTSGGSGGRQVSSVARDSGKQQSL
jgi:hypothetical protein